MRAYCITIPDNPQSEAGFNALFESHVAVDCGFILTRFTASTPRDVDHQMRDEGLRWTWPWERDDVCPLSGLKRHPYTTSDRKARMACFMSHYRLWRLSAETDEDILIFEDDALFTRALDAERLPDEWGAIGLNDPRGATRRAQVFHDRVQASKADVVQVPWVDDDKLVPQGLAGASAYLIRPWCARRLIGLVRDLGAWPNDAILCRQLVPEIGVLRRYATRVSRRVSTLA